MKEKETVTLVELSSLRPAGFLKTLFPLGRDWPSLRESVAHYGYKTEFPLVVRPRFSGEGLEIIDGIGRATLAREAGIERVSALVKVLEDEEARRYVVDANLYRANTQARIRLVPAIVLARDHQRGGGEYYVRRILELTGVSRATYKRAVAGLNFALETLRKTHTELGSRDEAEVVAACLNRKLWPEFAQFYLGELEPFAFYKSVYGESSEAKARRKKKNQTQTTGEQSQVEGGLVLEAGANDVAHTLDSKQQAVACLDSFLEMAALNKFIRQISEQPELMQVIDTRVRDLESVVSYLEAMVAYLKRRQRERKGEIKKARPREKGQFHLPMDDVPAERHA